MNFGTLAVLRGKDMQDSPAVDVLSVDTSSDIAGDFWQMLASSDRCLGFETRLVTVSAAELP